MNEDSLVLAQEDLFEHLLADPFVATVACLNGYKGDITADIEQSLGVFNSRSGGKVGACIIAQEPTGAGGDIQVAGGVLDIEFTWLILEDPTINQGAGGTGLRAAVIARRLFGWFYLYQARGFVGTLRAREPRAIIPVAIEGVPKAYEVGMVTREEEFAPDIKVATPTFSPKTGAAPQNVTITCVTADAEIYYTLDGSHPRAGNPTAVLYTGTPVNVAAAGTLRASAFKTDHIASNVNSATFS